MADAQIKRKLTSVKAKLTRLGNTIKNLDQNSTKEEIDVRIIKLEELMKEFDELQTEVELASDSEEQLHAQEASRGEVEERYFGYKAHGLRLINEINGKTMQAGAHELRPASPDEALVGAIQTLTTNQTSLNKAIENLAITTGQTRSVSSISAQSNDIKLPQINLPIFTGNYEEWPTFFDLFNSMIHTNTTLSGAQKLQYLKNSLKDDAASLLKNVTIGDANYESAWQSLIQRFNKETCIIEAHLKNLLEQPSLSRVTVVELRKFLTTTNDAINGLKALKLPIDQWDIILIHILLNKLDVETKRLWLREVRDETRPTFKQFMKFLENYLFEQEMLRKPKQLVVTPNFSSKKVLTTSVPFCYLCKGQHILIKCPEFIAMNTEKRKEWAITKSLCLNCLRSGHQLSNCKSSRCRICNAKHHTLVHLETKPLQQRPQVANLNTVALSSQLVSQSQGTQGTLLPTALVLVQDVTGQRQPCRILLDSGSQATLISEACVQRLRLQRTQAKFHIDGVGSTRNTYTRGKTNIHIHSRFNEETITTTALILQSLTGMIPASETNSNDYQYFSNINLADPKFYCPGRIDIILGSELFFEVLMDGRIIHPSKHLIAQNSMFGWIIGGKFPPSKQDNHVHALHACIDIDQQLRRFWEIEEINTTILTDEERKCEQHFAKTHKRVKDGRYQVKLPFKDGNTTLGDSKDAATRRLLAMERKFSFNKELQHQYQDFMSEYESLGHMQLVEQEQLIHGKYYMPHHAVLKPESTTTKLRVVFDASCKTTSGISLNEKLMVGATIQSDIVTHLIRFRKHKIAFSADIVKMYRQIWVDKQDTIYQRILWRQTPDESIKEYELLTVTYGTSSAPFLATRVLKQLSQDETIRYPLAAKALQSDFYVDDLMCGADTLQQAQILKNDLINMLKSAGFDLRKWSSNIPELLQDIPTDHREQSTLLNLDKVVSVNTLGLKWDTSDDCFVFNVNIDDPPILTKRNILSQIAKIYDPLGWLSPCTVRAKMLIQQLWIAGVQWDDPISEDLVQCWANFKDTLGQLMSFKLPRWLSCKGDDIQLHGFSDASERAYGAAIYLYIFQSGIYVSSYLVAAKTRVAPMKQLSTPRLELCAAHLMIKLLQKVRDSIQIPNIACYGWTDSTIVLNWLADHPRRWTTFVGNRTAEILEILPFKNWRHIASKNNPSDHASRGLTPDELINCRLWWNGPEIERQEILHLSNFKPNNTEETVINSEAKRTVLHAQMETEDDDIFCRYSTLTRLKRIISYCLRFKNNCKAMKAERKIGLLSTEELNQSFKILIRKAQMSTFQAEMSILQNGKQLKSKNRLSSLNPFLDSDNILRVGGRISQAKLAYDIKHPVILTKSHKLSILIVNDLHVRHLHAGQRQLLHLLNSQYWILGARCLIKRCIHKCITCVRFRGKTYTQQMGNLPSHRLQPGFAFTNTGVDYAGPIFVRSWKGRGAKTYKAYIALFICLATRAIHLEICSDMSTESFIAALRRFVSRRGLCSNIFSDNGTNFVGAERHFHELRDLLNSRKHNEMVTNFLSDQNIQWHFIPPLAPHFGGLWEAGVKSMKTHLRRVTANASLTFEEYSTLLCQIEACLNSRPLLANSFDAKDADYLSPGHFLIGRPITQVPEQNLEECNMNRLSRWQYIQRLNQEFWRRWSLEYVTQLQQRSRWRSQSINPEIGDIVLLKDENLSPCRWSIGKIIQLHPGADKLVRVVSVRTMKGVFKRPVVKLCPLPVEPGQGVPVEG